MNKNDFYKQLMSEYSFDADKIKSNARKGRFAGQKALPMYIGMTAAAAVLVVTVGTTAFMALDKNRGISESGVVLSDSSDSVLSANERFVKALEDIRKNAESSEQKDVMVTFAQPLSPSSAQAVLTAYSEGNVPVKRLYFEDGTSAAGSEQVEEAFNGGERRIKGALVSCAGYVMASLNEDDNVFLVEIVTEDNINTIAPIDTTAVDGNTVSIPADPQFPDDIIPIGPGGESADSSAMGSAEASDRETSDLPSAESSDAPDDVSSETGDTVSGTSEPSETSDNTSESVPEPPQTTPAESSAPVTATTPVEVQPEKLPEGVTLPESIEKFSYETVSLGAKDAFFMNERTFFVRTSDEIQMYAFNGAEEKLLAAEECPNAEICWISENADSLIVSATDENGKRNRLLYVDANGEQITDLNAADTVMEGTLKGVGYNADSGLLVMNILENGKYYVCAVTFSGGETDYLSTGFESSSPISLMASDGLNIYFSISDGSLAQIYEVNAESGVSRLIRTYENNPKVSSNLAFTHGIIYPSSAAITGNVEIFDPRTLSFAAAGGTNTLVDFGANKHSFAAGGSCYSINGGSITSAGGTAIIGRVEYRRSASSLYAAAAAGGRVRITSSIYSAKVKNSGLTFGELSDSASADIRAAVNGALAVNNLIAQGDYEKYGVSSPKELSECIDCFYSENAANALRSRCGISPLGGVMKYSSSGLISANVYDTVLTVSTGGNTASGILYIRAGSFGGKTGYISYNVKLINENGRWQVDSLLTN